MNANVNDVKLSAFLSQVGFPRFPMAEICHHNEPNGELMQILEAEKEVTKILNSSTAG